MYKYSNKDLLIMLNEFRITFKTIKYLLNNFEDLNMLFDIDINTLKVHKSQKEKLIKCLSVSNRFDIKLEDIYNRCSAVTILDKNYPDRLKNIYEPPYVLYAKGDVNFLKNYYSYAIVGSRKASYYGKSMCRKLVYKLAEKDTTIVSGLAMGIDTIAHDSSLNKGLDTIAVLGNGLDVIYPKSNEYLYKLLEEQGCIVTEFPFGMEPFSYNFPKRNRIISGLSLGVIVVEAMKKSGSLITAHNALDQGKDVYALPGNITSKLSLGTNLLIKDGAIPIVDIENMF